MTPTFRTRVAISSTLFVCGALSLGIGLAPILISGAEPVASNAVTLAQNSGPGGGRPPREAVDACEGKSSGAACSFEGRDGSSSGTCQSPESNVPAACVPEGMEPPKK